MRAGGAERFDLTGRAALVTGASSGLGRHFARVLAAAGAAVVVAARRAERLAELSGEIRAAGGRAHAVGLDVTDPSSVAAAFATGMAELGPITILVNAAGTAASVPFTDISEADWRRVLDVNLDGVFRLAQAGARHMQAHGQGGSIVNVASVLGLGVAKKVSAYAVSKAAVVQLTRAMALELARDRIRVNALAPGYFPSEMTAGYLASEDGKRVIARFPMARAGALRELDGPLLLLASDAGAYMTGTTLVVDGGALLAMG